MKEAPPLEILDRAVRIDASREIPLHAQVRLALRSVIEEHFEDGQQFWTELGLVEQLGLSQITVRRALHDLTREGLLERRRGSGSFVRKEKAGQIRSLGIFIPAYNSALFSSMLDHWAYLLRGSGRRIHIYHTHQGESVAEALSHLQGTADTEGIILCGNSSQVTRELFDALKARGFRMVNVDSMVSGLPCTYVGVDNEIGIRLSLRHLMDLGHRSVVLFVKEPEDSENVTMRMQVFSRLAREMGLESAIVSCQIHTDTGPKFTVTEALDGMWSQPNRPTAVLGVSDASAWAVLRWCVQRGLLVPDELSVMGFDDDRPSQYMNPSLTTTTQPLEAICRRALQMLQDGGSPEAEYIAPTLTIRESTAPSAAKRNRQRSAQMAHIVGSLT